MKSSDGDNIGKKRRYTACVGMKSKALYSALLVLGVFGTSINVDAIDSSVDQLNQKKQHSRLNCFERKKVKFDFIDRISTFWKARMFQLTGTQITGELRKWHTVSLLFNGPDADEAGEVNPFTDYRLTVTFTNGDKVFEVPGFFAADGDAANTSASIGNKWQVRFTPPETGIWKYTVSFRTGENIAVSLDETAGTAVEIIDGKCGKLPVFNSDKTGRDLRGKGRLEYVGEHYLQFADNKEYFLKAGSDSPENLLTYEDIDATPNVKGKGSGLKSYAAHSSDYDPATAEAYTWQDGKGTELLGAIKYLSDKGMNAFSFLTFSANGDDKNVFPHLQTKADVHLWKDLHHTRFDVSKMEQWNKIMSYADQMGMYLHFKLTETENEQLMDGGEAGLERKIYLREMIARFGHHLALNWNLGEENGDYGNDNMTHQERKDMAQYILDLDPYDSHIVVHTSPNGQDEIYPELVGDKSVLTGASIQTSKASVHGKTIKWRNESAAAGKKWVIANDEQGGAQDGITADAVYMDRVNADPILNDNRKEVRHKVLWGHLMAGGAGVEYYFGYQYQHDLNAEDFHSRATKWNDARIALNFFNQYLPFVEMKSMDWVTTVKSDYVFGKAREVYAVYLPYGGATAVTLPEGAFSVQWFNPRIGGELTAKTPVTDSIKAPDSNDWVAYITADSSTITPTNTGNVFDVDLTENAEVPTTPEDKIAVFEEKGGLVVIEAENAELPAGWKKRTEVSGFTGDSYIEFTGPNSMSFARNSSLIKYNVKINSPGVYQLKWHSRNGSGAVKSDEENDTWLNIEADEFYGIKSGSKVNAKDEFMKVWIHSMTAWSWNMKGEHHHKNGMNIFASFTEPGVYTITLSGRSKGHVIDRMVLFKQGTADPTSLTQPETLIDDADNSDGTNDDDDTVVDTPAATPKVWITSPENESTYELGQPILVSGSSSVDNAQISQIIVMVNGVYKKIVESADYSVTLDDLEIGTHRIVIRAIADNGNIAHTSGRTVIITEPATDGGSSVDTDVAEPVDTLASLLNVPASLKANTNGKFVCADKILDSISASIYANRTAVGESETFTVVDGGNGYVAIKAQTNDMYLNVDLNDGALIKANSLDLSDAALFEVVTNDDNTISFKSKANGRFISADKLLDQDECPLVADRETIGAWEKFTWTAQ